MKKKIIFISLAVIIVCIALFLFIPHTIDSFTRYSPDNQYRLEVSRNNFITLPEQLTAFGDTDYVGAYVKLVDMSSGKVLNKVYTDGLTELYFNGIDWTEETVRFRYSDNGVAIANWKLPRPLKIETTNNTILGSWLSEPSSSYGEIPYMERAISFETREGKNMFQMFIYRGPGDSVSGYDGVWELKDGGLLLTSRHFSEPLFFERIEMSSSTLILSYKENSKLVYEKTRSR